MRLVKVTDITRDELIGDRIELANTSWKRMVGLLGRSGINAGSGLWIRPSSGVHTVGMSFPIDVVGLDKNHRVIELWPTLVPYRLTKISFRLNSVIELPAGTIERRGIQLGDVLQIAPAA